MVNQKQSIKLNKQEHFDILYSNPQGARYHQGGNFFDCGGRFVDVDINKTVKEVPVHVKDKIEKITQEAKPDIKEDIEAEVVTPEVKTNVLVANGNQGQSNE